MSDSPLVWPREGWHQPSDVCAIHACHPERNKGDSAANHPVESRDRIPLKGSDSLARSSFSRVSDPCESSFRCQLGPPAGMGSFDFAARVARDSGPFAQDDNGIKSAGRNAGAHTDRSFPVLLQFCVS